MKLFFFVWLLAGMLKGNGSFAQTPPAYKVPDMYRFDYEVEQVVANKKNSADSSHLHFFYTRSGDYAAARMSGGTNQKGRLFLVVTRDGMGIIFNEHNKNITVISIRKLASDMADLTKWIRMDSVMAHMRMNKKGAGFHSVKTGNTRQTGGYPSEEYTVSGDRGNKGSVWITKVDFLTQGDYLLSATGGNWIKMLSGNQETHPLLQALTQSKTLVTDVNFKDSTGAREMEMHTISISPSNTTVSTSGYTISDYSNMTIPEIFQAEMKKRN